MLFSPCPSKIKFSRPPARDLAAELPADRAARAGDQHRLPLKVSPTSWSRMRAGSRRSRSVISTSRSRLTLTLPPISS